MLLKVNNEYIATVDIDIDRQVRLFEEFNNVSGDLSYEFTLPATSETLEKLNLQSLNDSNKTVYSKLPATLEKDGQVIYRGFLRVEKKVRRQEVDCTFYSGNSNWLALLPERLRDVDLSDYDQNFSYGNIAASWTSSETGIFYPVLNAGSITDRKAPSLHLDEMVPFIYVKDVILKMFLHAGLKVTGSLLNEYRYQKLITANNDLSVPQDEQTDRKTFVSKNVAQTIVADTADYLVTFNQTTGTYYPGDLWNTSTNRFTADVKMIVDVTVTANVTVDIGNTILVWIFKNGALYGNTAIQVFGNGALTVATRTLTLRDITLDSSDYIEIYAGMSNSSVDDGSVNTAKVTITPTRLYKVFTRSLVPDWSGKDFLYNIIAPFNPIVTYDEFTKTVHIDLFKNINHEQEIDLSSYVNESTIEEDYTEFISEYGESNILKYDESDEDELERYNRNNSLPYGAAEIFSNNENVTKKADIVALDFVPVIENNYNPFGSFLPKLSYTELEDDFEDTATITNDAGIALFTVGANHGFVNTDIVRVSDSTVDSYNGEWQVSNTAATTIKLRGCDYEANGTATITKLNVVRVGNSEQVVLLAIKNIALTDFANIETIYVDNLGTSSPAGTAYFYKPLQGLNIDSYKESLSFGAINIPNAHQFGYAVQYWTETERMLQDPVKVFVEGNLPLSVFESLDFKRPVRLAFRDFNARFYLNKISGYKDRAIACLLELIKLP